MMMPHPTGRVTRGLLVPEVPLFYEECNAVPFPCSRSWCLSWLAMLSATFEEAVRAWFTREENDGRLHPNLGPSNYSCWSSITSTQFEIKKEQPTSARVSMRTCSWSVPIILSINLGGISEGVCEAHDGISGFEMLEHSQHSSCSELLPGRALFARSVKSWAKGIHMSLSNRG